MKLTKQKSQFSALKLTLIMAAIIASVLIGYLVYSNYKANSEQTVSTSSEDVQTAPVITETADLEEATTAIDETEVESLNMEDMTEIDKELSSF